MIFAKPVLSSNIHIHFHISIVASRCSVNEISNDLSCTYIHTQKDCTSVRILSRATVKLLRISYTARSFPFVFHFSPRSFTLCVPQACDSRFSRENNSVSPVSLRVTLFIIRQGVDTLCLCSVTAPANNAGVANQRTNAQRLHPWTWVAP